MIRKNSILILALTVILAGVGTLRVAKNLILSNQGMRDVPNVEKPIDFLQRADETRAFMSGIYPNGNIRHGNDGSPSLYSVYPPYAFPILSALYWPQSLGVSLLILQAGLLLSLGFMIWMGWSRLRGFGIPAAMLGAAMALGLTGNGSCIVRGQLSLICVAFLILQMEFLKKGKILPASVCWAIAMVKPQIGLTFALPFMIRGRGVGLISGGVFLSLLAAVSFYWTGTSPLEYLNLITRSKAFSFIHGNGALGICSMICGVPSWVVILGSALLLIMLSMSVMFCFQHLNIPENHAFALCSALGFIFLYHHHYDIVMLIFLQIELTVICFGLIKTKKTMAIITWILMGMILYVPLWILELEPALLPLYFVAPATALCVIVMANIPKKNFHQ